MYTTEQIVALQPCYTEEEVAELVGDGITVQQIAAHGGGAWASARESQLQLVLEYYNG